MLQKLTQNNLLQFLNKKKLEPILQKETDQIYIVLKIANQEVPVFFGIRSEGHLLQTIAYIPFEVDASKLTDLARLLHLINRELDMPGFGLDEFQKLMFYRSVIPCLEQEMNEKLIEMYLGTMRIACETFMGAISAISAGTMNFEDAIKQTKKKFENQ